MAIDNNPERFKTLNKMVEERGATCVSTLLQDFTELTPDQYPDVCCIFLDPTCSASGLYLRISCVESLEAHIGLFSCKLSALIRCTINFHHDC